LSSAKHRFSSITALLLLLLLLRHRRRRRLLMFFARWSAKRAFSSFLVDPADTDPPGLLTFIPVPFS